MKKYIHIKKNIWVCIYIWDEQIYNQLRLPGYMYIVYYLFFYGVFFFPMNDIVIDRPMGVASLPLFFFRSHFYHDYPQYIDLLLRLSFIENIDVKEKRIKECSERNIFIHDKYLYIIAKGNGDERWLVIEEKMALLESQWNSWLVSRMIHPMRIYSQW